jgi:Protein of unknown function (DUF3866)
MIRLRRGTVLEVLEERRGAVLLSVEVEGEVGSARAMAYPDLTGVVGPGDGVLLNTTAVWLGLGTGGLHFVVAVEGTSGLEAEGAGRAMKLRYTPQQVRVLLAEEEDSPHRSLLEEATTLEGAPVVWVPLHSMIGPAVAGARAAGAMRVAYVMTDGAALPGSFSELAAALRSSVLLDSVVTCGQAFGGDLEAVTVHTGLLAARHVLEADVTVVAQGPGNLGTSTPWGFSGVAAGEVVNAVGVLGGQPVGALRISDADPRERHRGVSHHAITAFGRVALVAADLVVPAGLPTALAEAVAADLAPLGGRHRIVTVATDGLETALRALPVTLSTMGRSLDEDRAYFLAAAAAGRHAAALLG